MRTGSWFDETTELESVLLIGIDDKPSFMVNSTLLTDLNVTDSQSVFLDRLSHKDFGE